MLFITFEGPEGAGKTTVLKMIKEQLKQDGFDVIITREPGGSEISEQIRQVILNKENTLMDPWTEVLLYIAARRQHLIEKILPNKNSNKIIISDRFSDSTLAYQGYARNLDIDKINLIQKLIFEDYQPDLTVLFDIKPETGLQRILLRKGEKLNRLDEETLEFHQKVYNGYKKIAISNPNRVHTINANLSEKKVFNSVYELIINLVEEKGFKEKKLKLEDLMKENNVILFENEESENFSIFAMENIPQVILLYSKNKILNINVSNKLIKKIICKNNNQLKKCTEENMCQNCFKIKTNSYFDFKKFDFSKNNIMNKNIVLEIINDFSKTNLEKDASKIYLINQIEFSSISASNVMLKTLEELSKNIYVIFTTTNINQILPTIKSRCQLINCSKENDIFVSNNYDDEQLLILKIFSNTIFLTDESSKLKLKKYIEIIKQFIINDNDKKVNNQLLNKKIVSLKEEIIYFFRFFNLVVFNKLTFLLFKKYDFNNFFIESLVNLWKNSNLKNIAYILEQISFTITKLKFNVNLNLLINSFLIKVSDN